MSITITDVTAGLLVLTIDNSGQMCFGDGTPINMLTLAGFGIIDFEGHIIHGVGTANLNFTSGSGTLSYGQNPTGLATSAIITTLTGIQPTVQVDSAFPYAQTFFDNDKPMFRTTFQPSVQVGVLEAGQFTVQNLNSVLTSPDDPSPPQPLYSGNYAYRWL
jgi:hypothetical protein